MSVRELTLPLTKTEQWSSLYCYHLDAANLSADRIEKGALDQELDEIKASDIVITLGSGTPANSFSMSSTYSNGSLASSEGVFLSGSFAVTGAAAPQVVGNVCQFTIDVPVVRKIGYPQFGEIIGSSVSCLCRDSAGPVLTVSNAYVENNAGDMRIQVIVFGNVSGASATRQLTISYIIQYRRL